MTVSAEVGVPFLDLARVHAHLRDDILSDLSEVIESGQFVNGPHVAAFESAFATTCRTRFAVGVASGLDALRLALLAAGIERGDEVVVPAATFAATFEAVTQAGGVPVVVDVGPADYAMDPQGVEAAIGARTRFLLPVHLYGQMADMCPLRRIAAERGLTIIEDACQAHGAERDGMRPGAASAAAAFSFYPGKNLGAMGDAGAVVTDNRALATRLRALREHGQTRKYRHEVEGYTSRLDTIQAAVLLRKLPYLARWNDERRAAARFYTDALHGVGDLRLPPVAPRSLPAWHLYAVRTSDPERLGAFLAERGISTARHYPEPPHLSPAYAWLGRRRGSFALAEALADESLSLPLFPGITEGELDAVVDAVSDYFAHG